MSLFKQIKQDQLQARKDKNVLVTNLLTTLLGEITTACTGGLTASQFGILKPSDEDVTKIVKKFVKNTKETLRLKDNEDSKTELSILENYLPKVMSSEDLKILVAQYVSIGMSEDKKGGALVGYVMKLLKENYPNQYDASLVKGFIEG